MENEQANDEYWANGRGIYGIICNLLFSCSYFSNYGVLNGND